MATRTSPVVAIPSALLNGVSTGYTRRRAYVNPTTGLVEGDRLEVKLYNATGAATAVGKCYLIAADGDEETDPSVIALAADTAGVLRELVVAVEIVAIAGFGWFAFDGFVDACYHGTTDIAKDDFLKTTAATGTFSLLKDGTSQTAKSAAIACAAVTTDGELAGQTVKVRLLGLYIDAD